VNIWGLTVENEPSAGFDKNYTFNDLGFTDGTERDFVKLNLGPTLAKAGYGPENLKLMIYDDQRPNVFKWAQTILGDEESAKFVSGIAFHWYGNNADNVQQLDLTNEIYPEFFILATEACEEWRGKSHKVSLGNWATFERYANDIITVREMFV
jgi:glucosylceramidase